MTQEIILSKLFLTKLFKFYFYRNVKIFKTFLALLTVVTATVVYFITFLAKINYVISRFDGINYSTGIYLILILVLLFIISGWLIFAFIRLFNTSKYNFLDEIQKTFPQSSNEMIEIVNGTISSKNSSNNHMYIYQLTDLARYYVYNNILVLQFFDDNFIFLNYEKNNNEIKKIKETKLKKHFLKEMKKEEL